MNANQNRAALWQCDACGAWWCSQTKIEPTTFMLDISIDILEGLGWENFRGWRMGGTPHVATCSDCRHINSEPLLGGAPVGEQLHIGLRTLLIPAKKPKPEKRAQRAQQQGAAVSVT